MSTPEESAHSVTEPLNVNGGPSDAISNRKAFAVYFLIVLALLAVFAFSYLLSESSRERFLEENGIVETLSAIGYLLCAILILAKGKLDYLRTHWYFIAFVIFLGLRELDFHERFTTMGIFKSRFYISPDVPLLEKVIGAVILLFLIATVFLMIKNHFKDWIAGLKNFSVVSYGALNSIALVLISKSIDGLARKLEPLGIDLGDEASTHAKGLEEVLELGIPLFLIFTFWMYFQKRNPGATNLVEAQ